MRRSVDQLVGRSVGRWVVEILLAGPCAHARFDSPNPTLKVPSTTASVICSRHGECAPRPHGNTGRCLVVLVSTAVLYISYCI